MKWTLDILLWLLFTMGCVSCFENDDGVIYLDCVGDIGTEFSFTHDQVGVLSPYTRPSASFYANNKLVFYEDGTLELYIEGYCQDYEFAPYCSPEYAEFDTLTLSLKGTYTYDQLVGYRTYPAQTPCIISCRPTFEDVLEGTLEVLILESSASTLIDSVVFGDYEITCSRKIIHIELPFIEISYLEIIQ